MGAPRLCENTDRLLYRCHGHQDVYRSAGVCGRQQYVSDTRSRVEFGFTNLLGLSLEGVNRGDIVIVSEENEYWVKRVIALPNETIECRDGVVYIDGEALEEPYLDTAYVEDIKKNQGYFTSDFEPVTLGADEYFVMGDNRVVSADSRVVGPFTRDQIIGKGVFVLYPLDQIGYHNQ